jgi:hypothetical protein
MRRDAAGFLPQREGSAHHDLICLSTMPLTTTNQSISTHVTPVALLIA